MDDTFTALADPTRRAILNQLMAGPARVTDIAAPYSLSLNAISKHVRMLERAKRETLLSQPTCGSNSSRLITNRRGRSQHRSKTIVGSATWPDPCSASSCSVCCPVGQTSGAR